MTPPVPADAALAAFFQAAVQAFEQAAGAVCERAYRVGAARLQLRFANQRLLPRLTPALEHLAAPPDDAPPSGTPALTVCVWDSASTGIAMPPPVFLFAQKKHL